MGENVEALVERWMPRWGALAGREIDHLPAPRSEDARVVN